MAEKLTKKQKDKGKKNFSSSSDLRQRIGQKKRFSSDLRQRIGQKRRENFQDSEVINQNINIYNGTNNIFIIYLHFHHFILNFSLEAASVEG